MQNSGADDQRTAANWRLISYVGLSIILLLISLHGPGRGWSILDIDHTVLETGSTLIALFVGVLALVRYYSKREGIILIVGAAMIGTGLLDGTLAISPTIMTHATVPPANPSSLVWCFEISRLYLSAMFVFCWLDGHLRHSQHGLDQNTEYRIYFLALLLLGVCSLMFWLGFDSPDDIAHPLFGFVRTLLPAALFLLATAGFLIRGKWRDSDLDHWIILFLIANVAAQLTFITASAETTHALQVAHELKILSYLVLLVGMLRSMYHTFRESAEITLKIAEANVALKLEAEERRRAQEQTETAKNQAEKSDMAKSEFLSSMSHELRTPLNSILGFGQLLELDSDVVANQTKSESVEQILKAGRHLLELVNEVLDLSRIESGNLDLALEQVSVDESVKFCLSLSRSMAEKRGIQIEISEASPSEHFVLADLTRFRQVLLNLISNAIKYNRSQGSIRISSEQTDRKSIRVTVTDTGPGLNETQIGQIFEPFNRLAAANSQIEGTGIGLTITRRLIEMMGGTIGVESNPGEGATFWFELPAAERSSGQSNSQAALNSIDDGPENHVHKVLYIEDDPANLHLMKAHFAKRPDLALETAVTAEAGIEMATASPPCLILMDINLPGMNGYGALKLLQSQTGNASTPVIAVTARATAHDLRLRHEAGFSAYITKPFEVDVLFSEIDRVLQRAE